jgi:hypothetical protein
VAKVTDRMLAAVQKCIVNGTVGQLLPFNLENGFMANGRQVLARFLEALQNLFKVQES